VCPHQAGLPSAPGQNSSGLLYSLVLSLLEEYGRNIVECCYSLQDSHTVFRGDRCSALSNSPSAFLLFYPRSALSLSHAFSQCDIQDSWLWNDFDILFQSSLVHVGYIVHPSTDGHARSVAHNHTKQTCSLSLSPQHYTSTS
jgi:hypothetical protein